MRKAIIFLASLAAVLLLAFVAHYVVAYLARMAGLPMVYGNEIGAGLMCIAILLVTFSFNTFDWVAVAFVGLVIDEVGLATRTADFPLYPETAIPFIIGQCTFSVVFAIAFVKWSNHPRSRPRMDSHGLVERRLE